MNDLDYGVGKTCTWHGPLLSALSMPTVVEGFEVMAPRCPVCLGELTAMQERDYVDAAESIGRTLPDLLAISNWSRGKCFPDFDTLTSAYRQAMEE